MQSVPASDDSFWSILAGAFAPACYVPSWVPWLRWVGAAVVVVILVIVVRLAAAVPGFLALPVP